MRWLSNRNAGYVKEKNMKSLTKCRKQLDKIDKKIIGLFEKRMYVAKEVALFKQQNNLPVLDQARENAMLSRNLERFTNQELKKYYATILQAFTTVSKQYQQEIIDKTKNNLL